MTSDSCISADIRHLIARLSGLSAPISDYCRIVQSACGCRLVSWATRIWSTRRWPGCG